MTRAGIPARLLIATRSGGKARELRFLLAEYGVIAEDLGTAGIPESADEEALEVADTFEANALAKARHFFARTGIPTIADDSGLEVRALGGAPGVRSKRWSEQPELGGQALDDANNALLLARLAAAGTDDRSARYVCAAAYCDGSLELVARGVVDGEITREPVGRGGFGYDPYFRSTELGRTFAQVSPEEKARVSHRGRAVRTLLAGLERRR